MKSNTSNRVRKWRVQAETKWDAHTILASFMVLEGPRYSVRKATNLLDVPTRAPVA